MSAQKSAQKTDTEDMKVRILREGHVFDHTFFLLPLSGRLPLNITHEYYTKCKYIETSFRFGIQFRQERQNGPLCCSVYLRRIDEKNKPMRVSLWVSCIVSYKNLFEPVTFTNENMRPNAVIERNLSELITNEMEIDSLLNQKITFQSSVSVELCHPNPKQRRNYPLPSEFLAHLFFSKL